MTRKSERMIEKGATAVAGVPSDAASDAGLFDLKIVFIRHLSRFFIDCVFADRLPPADSFLTNQQYSLVVASIADNPTGSSCDAKHGRHLLQVTAYERTRCDDLVKDEPGLLPALIHAVELYGRRLENSDQGWYKIHTITRQSSNPLPYAGDDIKAIALTIAIDYTIGENLS